jgi:uncharacterized iron-regulated membrane protein
MRYRFTILNRKIHYWLSLFVVAPFLIVVSTGVLLLLKKDVAWVQPPTMKGEGKAPSLAFERVLEICKTAPEAGVASWSDITRIDVQVGKGVMKVQTKSSWEIQLDSRSGAILQTAYRRSDLIESLHDGSFFHNAAKYGVFLPAALGMLILTLTGAVLFAHPLWVKMRRGGAFGKKRLPASLPKETSKR